MNDKPVPTLSPETDISFEGDVDAWEIVCKASSPKKGWMKSTKRMTVPGGYLYQVTTEFRQSGQVTACAEAITFVPDNSAKMVMGGTKKVLTEAKGTGVQRNTVLVSEGDEK